MVKVVIALFLLPWPDGFCELQHLRSCGRSIVVIIAAETPKRTIVIIIAAETPKCRDSLTLLKELDICLLIFLGNASENYVLPDEHHDRTHHGSARFD